MTQAGGTATNSQRGRRVCVAWSPTLRIWATPIPVEQDDSLLDWDRRQLYALARDARLPLLRYQHQRASAEQLLAIPDAIAWCWAKGGDWRRRIQPVVTTVRRV